MSALPMDEPLVDTELADTAPQRRSGPWKLILIVVILTVIGIWLVPGEEPQEPAVTKMPVTPGEALQTEAPSLLEKGDETAPVEEEAVVEAIEPEAIVDERPGAKARMFIAQMRSSGELKLDEIHAAADAAQAAGELPDAYLLYFFAAREGHVPSALTLGRQADPASHDPASSVFEMPDLNQAHKWYQFAAENGDAEARQQLEALRARVEQMAADGDPQAQRITLLWQ